MMWTISCTITDKDGNSRLVSGARLRGHEAALHAACALLYLSGGLTWSLNPLLAGWGAWVLAAGLGMMVLGIAMATRMYATGDVGHIAGWLGARWPGSATERWEPRRPAPVLAIAGDGDAAGWCTLLALPALIAVLYYDPKSTRNVRRDPLGPRTNGNPASA